MPRRVELALFLLLWLSFAWFHHSLPGWNVNSRLALTYALVEKGTIRLNEVIRLPAEAGELQRLGRGFLETGDAAVLNGNLYSDKIIGTSLVGIPAFAVLRTAEWIRDDEFSLPVRQWVVTSFSISLLGAAAGVFFFRIVRLSFPVPENVFPWGALIISVLTFLGTGLWFYATLFMSYVPAVFFLLWSLHHLLVHVPQHKDHSPTASSQELATSRAWPHLPLFLAGVLAGAAVLCEYLAGIAAAGLGLFAASAAYGLRGRLATLLLFAAGGVVGLMPFVIYTLAAFGSLSIPYDHHIIPTFKEEMSRGLMGATFPDPDVLALLTVHPFRGIFIHSSWLPGALAGLGLMMREKNRRLAILAFAVFGIQLLYNSAYYMWWGGWSFTPRHLLPAVPFLALGAAAVWQRWKSGRIYLLLAGAASVVIHLAVNAVDPQIRDTFSDPSLPVYLTLPMLLEPDLGRFAYPWTFPHIIWPSFLQSHGDMNLGRLAGLPAGWPSVLPLIAVWVGAVWMLRRRLARRVAPGHERADVEEQDVQDQ